MTEITRLLTFTGALMLVCVGVPAYAEKLCYVTEICTGCTEDGDTGTKLRLYTQHCKEQGRTNNAVYATYVSGPVGRCKLAIRVPDEVDCSQLAGN